MMLTVVINDVGCLVLLMGCKFYSPLAGRRLTFTVTNDDATGYSCLLHLYH